MYFFTLFNIYSSQLLQLNQDLGNLAEIEEGWAGFLTTAQQVMVFLSGETLAVCLTINNNVDYP